MPLLGFDLQSMSVQLHAVRQDTPPQINAIDCLVRVETDESDHRPELLHKNIRRSTLQTFETGGDTGVVPASLAEILRRRSSQEGRRGLGVHLWIFA